ncbi:MAG: sensor histidine kinase [Desulfobacteraceae bacterium]|nr:MAG: sensor histidine kinase [Desulfobacteraceae bacterium]
MDILTKVKGKRYRIFILSIAAIITALHFLVFARYSPLIVLEELYYIPLFLAALWLGFKGAIMTYVLVSFLYFPFFFGGWTTSALGAADRSLHLIFSGIFTFTAGFVVDHERRRRQHAEREKHLAGIGQAAATIVHDLKNPLIVILGYGRRIQEGKGSTEAAVQAIMDSAHSMERIVDDVLDFARPIRLELKEEDARTVIRRVYDFCAIKAQGKGVSLSLDIPGEQVTIDLDSDQMKRALINMVNNAIEASNPGQKVVLVAARGKRTSVIRISDYGSGMDKETLEKLFTPFFTTKKGGTGLGMSIAKKIIEAHDGTIRIESRQGTGTDVIIDMPYKGNSHGK